MIEPRATDDEAAAIAAALTAYHQQSDENSEVRTRARSKWLLAARLNGVGLAGPAAATVDRWGR